MKAAAVPGTDEAAKDSAVAELMAEVVKTDDGTTFPGVNMAFPLKDFGGDLDAWATCVETMLTAAHREDVMKIRDKGEKGCASCTFAGCRRCWWPHAVRYWRRLETGGHFHAVEGYSRLVKTPTKMKIEP